MFKTLLQLIENFDGVLKLDFLPVGFKKEILILLQISLVLLTMNMNLGANAMMGITVNS